VKNAAKALIVDDMDMILFVIKGQIQRYGLQVDTAASGAEAVEKVKSNSYDIIFMDHLMPGMDGIEAAGEIRKWESEAGKGNEVSEGNHIPIIALTANINSDAEGKFTAAGFNGFLSKPVAKQDLEATLKKWLPDLT